MGDASLSEDDPPLRACIAVPTRRGTSGPTPADGGWTIRSPSTSVTRRCRAGKLRVY